MQLPNLNFPAYNFRIQKASPEGQSLKIFDIIRKKFIALTPEEWVRQHLIHFLVNERKFPQTLISVEKKLLINGLLKRTDLVIYSTLHKPLLLVECKAPSVKIDQQVFDQAARYNLSLDLNYYILSNGIETYCCKVDHLNQKYDFLENIPAFQEL